jgi:hypothetical protein
MPQGVIFGPTSHGGIGLQYGIYTLKKAVKILHYYNTSGNTHSRLGQMMRTSFQWTSSYSRGPFRFTR